MKQLSTQQQQWLDNQVPPLAPAGALGQTTMSEIVNDLYQLGGVVVSYTSNATLNTADTVTHNLGRNPAGYIVIQNGNGGVIYNGAASFAASITSTTISLKCTTASNAVTVLVF